MNTNNSNFYSNLSLNGELYFDDQPVETMIYLKEPSQNPSPVNIVLQWINGQVLTRDMESIVTKLLISNYSIAIEQNRALEASIVLKTALKEIEYQVFDKIKVLIALWKLSENIAPVESPEYYSSAKEIFNQHENEIDDYTRRYYNRLFNRENIVSDPYYLRSKALDNLEKGDFAGAENIYLNLIERKFELPGTYCHLARAQLLMHDENAARKSVNCAWKLRKNALNYVVPRIVFLKTLLLMIENRNPSIWIYRIKALLIDDSASLQWDIESTIREFEVQLGHENYLFMHALAKAIQKKDKIETLDTFGVWKR